MDNQPFTSDRMVAASVVAAFKHNDQTPKSNIEQLTVSLYVLPSSKLSSSSTCRSG